MHRSSPNWLTQLGEGSDHLQLLKFWPSCTPEKGVCSGVKNLAPHYYGQRTVFASLRALFSFYFSIYNSTLTRRIVVNTKCLDTI